jgi:hypothetical protein
VAFLGMCIDCYNRLPLDGGSSLILFSFLGSISYLSIYFLLRVTVEAFER